MPESSNEIEITRLRDRVGELERDIAVAKLERNFYRRLVRGGTLSPSTDALEVVSAPSCPPLLEAEARIARLELEQGVLKATLIARQQILQTVLSEVAVSARPQMES